MPNNREGAKEQPSQMDEILSQFIKDPAAASGSMGQSSGKRGTDQSVSSSCLQSFGARLSKLQADYNEHVHKSVQIGHEIERLFRQYEIVTGKANLVAKEISLLTMEQLRGGQTMPIPDHSYEPHLNGMAKQPAKSELQFLDSHNDLALFDGIHRSFSEEELILLKEPKKLKQANTKRMTESVESNSTPIDKFTSSFQQPFGQLDDSEFRSLGNATSSGLWPADISKILRQPKPLSFSSKQSKAASPSASFESTVVAQPSSHSYSEGSFMVDKIQMVKVFKRKARFISFNTCSQLQDLMVTGSLDGQVQFWSYENRKVCGSAALLETKNTESKCIPEDVHWNYNQDSVGVVWCGEKASESYLKVFTDFQLSADSISSSSFQIKCSAHTRNVRCVASLPTPNQLHGVSRFITAGDDKTLISWTVGGEAYQEPKVDILHSSRHTAAIQCLHYSDDKRLVITGGADCKLMFYGLDSKIIDEYKLLSGERISNIIARPNDPNTLLFSLCIRDSQLNLFDLRIRRTVQRFGWAEGENLSRYATPSWHSSGNYVSFGSIGNGFVNIWDIRNIPSQKAFSATRMDSIKTHHDGRILKALFHPTEDSLITCSTMDNAVDFITLKYAE